MMFKHGQLFVAVKNCLLNPTSETKQVAHEFLKNIYKIYEVYFDLFVVDIKGEVIVAAQNESQVGEKHV
ncbi:hypothetical protein KHA80_08525 [Anaerobacillus sp. HL2]|nr:hypothetical protein KHA80_08525 [Anaerobacillus sp. HL2]